MKDLLPFLGDRTIRSRLDEVFSREMLGAVLVGSAAGKMVEQTINLVADSTVALLFGWTVAFVVFLALFVAWERVADAAAEAGEKAKEAAEEAAGSE